MNVDGCVRTVTDPNRSVVGKVPSPFDRVESEALVIPIPIGKSGRRSAAPSEYVRGFRLVPPLVAELEIVYAHAQRILKGLREHIADDAGRTLPGRCIFV